MIDQPKSPFLFIIDTTDYAGNFERELCAYVTGVVGECGVGKEHARMFKEETDDSVSFENVALEPDEHGCWRPVTLYHSAASPANSVAIFFETRPSRKQTNLMINRALKFAATIKDSFTNAPKVKKILGFRLVFNEVQVIQTELPLGL